MHVVENKSTRVIARELGIAQATVMADLRAEAELRSQENEERRAFDLMASLAQYRAVIANEWEQARVIRGMMLGHEKGALRIVDNTMANVIAAQTRIDKLLGLEAPTKVDLGLDLLIDAIEPKSVTPAIEGDVVERE